MACFAIARIMLQHSYVENEAIPLHVNKVYSDNTQLQYAFYDLPFVCPPTGEKHAGYASGRRVSLNLGEVLRGDRIMASDYDLAMGQDNECRYLGSHKTDRKGVQRARQLIEDGYVTEYIVDNLPGATSFVTPDKSQKYYAAGFKLGFKDFSPTNGRPRYFINNHLIRRKGGRVIVGFEVFPKSIEAGHRDRDGCPQDVHGDNEGMELYLTQNSTIAARDFPHSSDQLPEEEVSDGMTLNIPYSYSVYYREDNKIEWSRRWDPYFNNQEEGNSIHWLAIINSLVISSLLTAVVVMIFAKTIIGDVRGRSKDGSAEEGRVKLKSRPPKLRSKPLHEKSAGLLEQKSENEEGDNSSDDEFVEDVSGWKQLHGDAFRSPHYAGLLPPLIGSGSQLVFMAFGLLILSTLGVLNPSFRGGFVSVGVGLFIFAGLVSGYFSARLYKTFNGSDWRRNTLQTALLFPGALFTTLFVLNLFVWAQASSTALPFGTLVGIVALWLLVQLPLVYVGSWYGEHYSKPYDHPTKTSKIPRQIPGQPWYTTPAYSVLLAGLVPFAVIFIELLFVFRSIWQDKSGYYYVFGFLSVVSFVNIVTVIEVTIVSTYVQLCAENYHWWWQSIFTGAGSAVWIYIYCVWFYWTKLNIQGLISGLLFFSYCGLGCAVYGLLMGTVGFITAYTFVRRIYA
ncbi:uncharacterized protein KY384_001520 [Bacidia gigantensis]|uniref:uncharacterized protein n=1 Tax=Bacidia gigantensis TaxID=2732470 RepID=UPI001D050820|nr:uncharacterized protein KY384_001520 [Bacidia gigantensis]KAG8533779.1 hypothetical protein KY384_001520 [Bacidia gigantensis]